ncbi:hypothetical protein N7451_012413 [Penicillium sp. IBT 35674x]|nr:hypothetical protein N7451_012413 [Penicillium sp. IBT 35674x]
MVISYQEALNAIEAEAQLHANALQLDIERVPLRESLGRVTSCILHAPSPSPPYDSSAMDGYAVNSEATQTATLNNPVTFYVKGLIAAGDDASSTIDRAEHGVKVCVEIMTGGRFPTVAAGDNNGLDCCVKWEDVERQVETSSGNAYIKIYKPARYQQNRRLAGEDLEKGDAIVPARVSVRPQHIIALASVGIKDVPVLPKPKVGLYSTGSELIHSDKDGSHHPIGDANGPYIVAVLQESGVDADFLGVLDDDVEVISSGLRYQLEQRTYDMIISTGAVSTGKFDLIPSALQRLGARIIFHKVDIRPGHPVLFAKIPKPDANTEIPFFGLPGNPAASAACLRFLTLPYLNHLLRQSPEQPRRARMRQLQEFKDAPQSERAIARFPAGKDIFRLGTYYDVAEGGLEVTLIDDHSPGKASPFLNANCWIHIHKHVAEIRRGDIVDIYPSL